MGQLYLMIQMIEYLESLRMKAECKTIFKIIFISTFTAKNTVSAKSKDKIK